MMYTLDLIVISIGIIEFFQLVSILTFLVYSYILYVCMLSFQMVSISIGIKLFIHLYVLFVLIISLYL